MFKYLNEDCFNFLQTIPSKSVNLILIDPPYEISRPTNFQSGEETGRDTDRFRISMDFGEWDKNFTGLNEVIKEGYRILKDGVTFICFYDLWKITPLKEMFEKKVYDKCKLYEFEDMMLNGPEDYDLVLTQLYGDYMTPPNQNERNKHGTKIVEEKKDE